MNLRSDSILGFLRLPRVLSDRVVQALLAAAAILTVLDPLQASESLEFTVRALVGIAPLFLLAVITAGAVRATGADRLISQAFAGKIALTVLAAALAGALSPFCSCGVIPLIAAMLASGVPLAPVMAFWVSSPIMDPEMFFLTAAGINLQFAVAKTIIAFVMGVGAGYTVAALQKVGFLTAPLKSAAGCGCDRPAFNPRAPVTVHWRFWRQPGKSRQFLQETVQNAGFLGKWMTLAFFLESLMMAYIPEAWITAAVGRTSAAAIPLGTVIGIPAYLNGYAAIPMVAGLLQMGMTPGAAMAFATAGAVASIPAAMAVYALVRPPVFAEYIGLGLAGSVLAGYGYQLSVMF